MGSRPAVPLEIQEFTSPFAAQGGDVGLVVAGVPGVEGGGGCRGHLAQFGVAEGAVELRGRQGLEQTHPTEVQGFDGLERSVRGDSGIVQIRPLGFVVGFDEGIGLSEWGRKRM